MRKLVLLIGMLAATAVGAFLSGGACAQPVNNNYYAARSDKYLGELLATVEQYHLGGGIDGVRRKMYIYAWQNFNFILNYFPNHPRVLLLMADLCQAWKDPKCNSESYFDKAIELTPNIADLYVTKGIYLQKKNRIKDAIESYEKALTLNPDSLNAHYNLGLAYVAQKEYQRANEHAQRAYALNPTLPGGLREKLVKVGAWKPDVAQRIATGQAAEPAAGDAVTASPQAGEPSGTEATKPSDGDGDKH